MTVIKRISLIFLIVFLALVFFLAVFDWNHLRSFVGSQVAERSGRQFVIDGNLTVRPFSLSPLVRMEKVRFQNAPWGTAPEMISADVLEFRVRLIDLLRGDVVLPLVTLSQPDIVLEKNVEGLRNWILKKKQTSADRAPYIGRLIVDRGNLIFRDPKIRTDIRVEVSTVQAPDPKNSGIIFNAKGLFQGLPTSAQGEGGSVVSLRDESAPYRLKGRFQIGETALKFDGTIRGLVTFADVQGNFILEGKDMAQLFPITKVALPQTPPYRIESALDHHGDLWSLKRFSGHVGKSDLSGDMEIKTEKGRRVLVGNLQSRVMDIADLAGFIGATPQVTGESTERQRKEAARRAAGPKLLPTKPLKLDRLKTMDADVRLAAKSIRREGLPLDNLVTHLVLKDGVLALKPLNFGVAGGNIVSDIRLDATRAPSALQARFEVKKLQLSELLPQMKSEKASFGLIGGRAQLDGQGMSLGEILSKADGDVSLVASGGTVSGFLLALAEINIGEIVRILFSGDENVPLRCAVFDFGLKTGIMNTRIFVIDTEDTNFMGNGQINLQNESIDLTVKANPKSFRLAAPSPIRVTGTFKDLNAGPETGPLIARGGAAVALGALTGGIGAILPLIEAGPGQDSPCSTLIAQADPAGKKIKK